MATHRVERFLVGAALVVAGMAWGPAAHAADATPAKKVASAQTDSNGKGAKKKKSSKKKKKGAADAKSDAQVTTAPVPETQPAIDTTASLTSADVSLKAKADASASSGTAGAGAKAKAKDDETKKDEAKKEEPKKDDSSKDEKKDDKPEEPIFEVGGDFVMGSAQTNTVTGVVPPASTAGLNGITTTGLARITDYSLIVGAGMKVQPCLGLGLRLPLEGGTLFANPTRSTGGVGNFELKVWGTHRLTDMLNLDLSLAVTLPTAGGTQTPTNPANVYVSQAGIDQAGYDRYSVQRAVSMSRGLEDDELFEVNRLGINPKVALHVGPEHGKWDITPWVKLNNLIATNKSYSGIEELVFGLNISAFLIPEVQPMVRIWANAPLSGADFTSTAAVIEPQLRFHFGPITPYVGGILPIAGLVNPYAYGVRVGLSAEF
jgi:hypothetical protein